MIIGNRQFHWSRAQGVTLGPLLLLVLMLLPARGSAAHNDVVVMSNGDHITCQIKRLQRSMLVVRPDYTKRVDVWLEWSRVASLQSDQLFVLVTSNGARFSGTIRMGPDDPNTILISDKLAIDRSVVVEIQELKRTFWNRWKVDLYLGYTLTKANSQNQISARADTRYRTDRAETKLGINSLSTIQKEGQESRRYEGSLGWRRELARLWFLSTAVNLLRSDEQALDLRSTTSAGAGRYLFRTALASTSASLGIAWTYENFADSTGNTVDSAEGLFTVGGDVYGYRNFELTSTVDVYPSLTEGGRWRVNVNLDVKWEIVKDLNFLINYFQNWDNANEAGGDYGIVSSVGWTL